MTSNMFNQLFQSFSRTGSDRKSSVRNTRPNRRYSLCLGLEGLEGRLAPSGGIAPVGVTVTNQGDTTPSNPGDPTTGQNGSTNPVATTQNDAAN